MDRHFWTSHNPNKVYDFTDGKTFGQWKAAWLRGERRSMGMPAGQGSRSDLDTDRRRSTFQGDAWFNKDGTPTLKFAQDCSREWDLLEAATTQFSLTEAATRIAYCVAQRRGRDY